MDETTQETFLPETEPQAVEPVPAVTVAQVTEPVTVPPDVSKFDNHEIVYGVDYSTEPPTEYTPMETVATTTEPVYIDVIETVGSDIVHSSLFGSFLISGTLVGLALLRKIYGT